MNPHSKPCPLFFTPRSPWGRLPLKRARHGHMRASENDTDDSIRLPKGLYVKPDLDSKNPEGKTEVNVDVGKSFKFPWEVKQEENDRLRRENNAKIAAAASCPDATCDVASRNG